MNALRFVSPTILAAMLLPAIACAGGGGAKAERSPEESVAAAKRVMQSYAEYVRRGDVDGIVGIAAEDIVVLTPGRPLIQGSDSFRELYRNLLESGTFDMKQTYEGAEVVGELVTLHGVATGTALPHQGESSTFANNFLVVMKPGPDGRMKYWRMAFAPAGQ